MIGKRKLHEVCWINVVTTELDKAEKFFGQLLGWTYADGVLGGHSIQVGGLPAGALMDQAVCPPEVPVSIGIMIKVANAEETVAQVIALGGRAEPVFDVMENGCLANCTDPNGGVFAVWQPLSKDGAECDTQAPSAPTWFETLTTDLDVAVEFYTKLFGWTGVAQDSIPGMHYTVFEQGGVPVAGAMRLMPDKVGTIRPHWATYFAVTDVDATASKAQALGGALCMGPHDIPRVGRFTLLQSPQGVSFHAIKFVDG